LFSALRLVEQLAVIFAERALVTVECIGTRGVGRSPIKRARVGAELCSSENADALRVGTGAGIAKASTAREGAFAALDATESRRDIIELDSEGSATPLVSALDSVFFSGAFLEAVGFSSTTRGRTGSVFAALPASMAAALGGSVAATVVGVTEDAPSAGG